MSIMAGQVGYAGMPIFAKNSSRRPNEPQVLEWHAAQKNNGGTIRTAHMEVSVPTHSYAMIISRPLGAWGAEMGVNEHGVCIGTADVYTKGMPAKSGLCGGELARIALQCSNSASQAIKMIILMLEAHGQSGDSGHKASMRHDSTFLIMDHSELFVLESAKKEWVYKRLSQACIANHLTISLDGDGYSSAFAYDFAKKHRGAIRTMLSGSYTRLTQAAALMGEQQSVPDMFTLLRHHSRDTVLPLQSGDTHGCCMHSARQAERHTTASMVVQLGGKVPQLWVTASSTPCISLFKPFVFGTAPKPPVFEAGRADIDRYWRKREAFHRMWIGHELPQEFYEQRDALQTEWLEAAEGASTAQMQQLMLQSAWQEDALYEKWAKQTPDTPKKGGGRFLSFWERESAELDRCEDEPQDAVQS